MIIDNELFVHTKLGNMLMNPKSTKDAKRKLKKRPKGDSGEDEEEAGTARLLSEDPLDWMLKNEKVNHMLSVGARSVESFGELLNSF